MGRRMPIGRRWPHLAKERPWVIPSYGVHPWHVAARAANWEEQLRGRLDAGGVIGEIGLDRWKEGLDHADQERVFRAQWALAAERDLPATVHCLRAFGTLWDIVREGPAPARGFLLHAYSGPAEMVEGFAARGAYFSFSGSFLAEGRERKRDTFLAVPLERLLVRDRRSRDAAAGGAGTLAAPRVHRLGAPQPPRESRRRVRRPGAASGNYARRPRGRD